MNEEKELQKVTRKLLLQVEAVLDEGRAELSALKQAAGILKDIRDIQRDAAPREEGEGGIRVILEGEVAGYGG